jgi:tetratricopeptide (TPR) repeat protein
MPYRNLPFPGKGWHKRLFHSTKHLDGRALTPDFFAKAARSGSMPERNRVDFFLSRRGTVATIAQEVVGVLSEQGYKVVVQDYDIPLTANFVEAMHEAIKNARDLVVLFTHDYEVSPYTRKEFTSFEADRAQSTEERRVVILRCEDVPLRGLFAPNVYQDLFGVDDPEERRRRILWAAEGRSQAPRPPPRPFVGVPPSLASFTGREAELDRLDAILTGGRVAAVTQATGAPAAQIGRAAVQGMGGVGKTSLAVEYACRYRDLYAGVWWCPAATRFGLLTSLAGLAKELGAAATAEADIEKAAKAGLRRLAEQRATFLLVYDNVANPEAIADLLPASGARVLVTSRFVDWSGWAEELALDVLPAAEAVAFVENRAGRQDRAGAAVLAEALGRLPLALDQAAAYCKRTQMGFAAYAARAEKLIAAVPRGASYPRSVAATFDLAIAEAVAECAGAEPLMGYLAACAPERIPMALVEGAIPDAAERVVALLALSDVSLVRHDPFEEGTPAVTVHRLVQVAGRARAEARGGAVLAAEHVVERLAAIYPNDGYNNPASWPLCAQLTPHLLARCEQNAAGCAGTEGQADLLDRAGSYFHGHAAYTRARLLYERALAIHEQALDPSHPEIAASLHNLADLLRDQGDPAAARSLYERALTIREQALGPSHPETAASLLGLADVLRDHGDFSTARLLIERALTIHEEAFGPGNPVTGASLGNLASLLQDQGDLAAARPLFERALAIYEKVSGPEHPDTARSLNNLAVLLLAQRDLAAARPPLERALAINEKVLGSEHPDTATSLNNLARLLRDQSELAAARPLFERALTVREKALGPGNPVTAASLGNLASLLQDQGDLAAARPLFERALAIYEKVSGPEHRNTAVSLNNLARVLQDQGDRAGARPLFERALAIHAKALGPEHPDTRRTQSNLAQLLRAAGDNPVSVLAAGEAASATHQKVL